MDLQVPVFLLYCICANVITVTGNETRNDTLHLEKMYILQQIPGQIHFIYINGQDMTMVNAYPVIMHTMISIGDIITQVFSVV